MRANLNEESCQLAQEPRLSDNSSFPLYVVTDGSGRELPRKRQCGGWDFAAMMAYPRHGWKPLVEACGPVHTSADADLHVGAIRATNNIGEMQESTRNSGAFKFET